MPLRFNRDELALDICDVASELEKFLFNLGDVLALFVGILGSIWGLEVVNEQNRRLLTRFVREEQTDIMTFVELLDPTNMTSVGKMKR